MARTPERQERWNEYQRKRRALGLGKRFHRADGSKGKNKRPKERRDNTPEEEAVRQELLRKWMAAGKEVTWHMLGYATLCARNIVRNRGNSHWGRKARMAAAVGIHKMLDEQVPIAERRRIAAMAREIGRHKLEEKKRVESGQKLKARIPNRPF